MTNGEMLDIAMKQSAIDSSCNPEDFLLTQNKVVISKASKGARSYLTLPFYCDLTSYGNNIVASVSDLDGLGRVVKSYIDRYPMEHCFETPNLYALNGELEAYGLKICFMAEYFLLDINGFRVLSCPLETRLLKPEELSGLYTNDWSNALCEKRKHLDMAAVGAFDSERLVGLAGCSADCEAMWQIGIDVLPEYRRRGIASALTTQISAYILEQGKVPFYCCAWSNVRSARNAIKSGFRPAWVQVTAKEIDFIDELNRK